MGVFRTTFIHESVHAAQACKTGEFMVLDGIIVDESVRVSIESILYRKYSSNKFDIERKPSNARSTDAITKFKRLLGKLLK